MTHIDKFKRYRLVFSSILVSTIFIYAAVPFSIELRSFMSDKPILTTDEITKIVNILYMILAPILILIFLYGVWFANCSKKLFWALVAEKFIFHMHLYVLAVGLMILYKNMFIGKPFHLSWDFFGFSVACTVFMFQWSFQTVKKYTTDS